MPSHRGARKKNKARKRVQKACNTNRGEDLKGRCCDTDYKLFLKREIRGMTSENVPSPLTVLLGTGRERGMRQWEVTVSANNRCALHGEELEFRRQCGSTIRFMDAALPALRFRRGLVIRLQDVRAAWGWGHVLTTVFAWHLVCQRLRRFCYVQAFDTDFDQLFGYANGDRWEPTRVELAMYGNATYLDNGNHPPAADPYQIPDLYKRLAQHDSSPLLVLTVNGNPPFNSFRWLPYDLPLRFDNRSQFSVSNAEAMATCLRRCRNDVDGYHGACESRCLGQWDHLTSRLDRCFARYVTQPLFSPGQFYRSMGTLPVAYHLRTGYADLPDQALQAHQMGTTPSADVGSWFRAACNASRIAQRQSWIMSDNPFLLRHLHGRYEGTVRSNYEALPRLSFMTRKPRSTQLRGSVSTTRIWNSSSEAKREAALDAYVAGLVPEIQISPHTSFARPIVARSMCTHRVVPLTRGGVCPEWDAQFFRDLHGWAGSTVWPCVERALPASHGCKGAPTREGGLACQRHYVASMIGTETVSVKYPGAW